MTSEAPASKRGPSSKARVATYIAGVGEGNTFSKLGIYSAVPGVSQLDRRMRELREIGWVIDHYKMNPTLKPSEYLLRKIGVRVDLGEKAPTKREGISGPKRRRIMERDGLSCHICGIAAGMNFSDAPNRRAILTIGHIIPVSRGGGDEDDNLRSECTRCNEESRDVSNDPPTPAQVLTQAMNVGGIKEKRILFSWMQAGRRTLDDKEQVFNSWARLPHAQQIQVMQALSAQVVKPVD